MSTKTPWTALLKEPETFNEMPCRVAGYSGLRLSAVGLGLWKWGDPSYDKSKVGDHEGFAILDRALELGVFHWDTACSYNQGSGNSERLIGRWFKSRGSSLREKVVLATKAKNAVREEHQTKGDFTPNQLGSSRVYLRAVVENGLRRLQTDHIDLLALHGPIIDKEGNWLTPLEETWGTLDDLVTEGKVRYLGLSNHSARQIAEVQKTLEQVGKDASRRIITAQNHYSLLERKSVAALNRDPQAPKEDAEHKFLEFCATARVGVIPYFPLASGALTGRYRKANLDQARGRLTEEGTAKGFLRERNLEMVEKIAALAEDAGVPMARLAIAWLLSKPVVSSVIAGVTSMAQLEENAEAGRTELSSDVLAKLEEITSAE